MSEPDEAAGEAGRWFAIAADDLAVAEAAMSLSPPRPGAAAYHLQQAAERILKAILVVRGRPFRRTHDLTALLEVTALEDDLSASDRDFIAEMTAWGAAWRYPALEEDAPPDDDELQRAVEIIRKLMQHAPG